MSQQSSNKLTRMPKLLLVDAEHELLEALRLRLEEDSFDVLTAQSGEEALSLLTSADLSLIIIEPELIDMNGIKLGEMIKERSSTPFLFLTSGSAATYREAAKTVGALTILSKGIHLDDLAAQIQLALNHALEYSHTKKVNRQLVSKLNRNDKRENLIGAYMTLWGEDKRRVKATLDKFARYRSVSIDRLAELHQKHCELTRKVNQEYAKQLDDICPEMLRDLQNFYDSCTEKCSNGDDSTTVAPPQQEAQQM